MEIRNLEELLQTISPDIAVFDEEGEITPEAADVYDRLVPILEYLYEQGVIANRDVIDRLDSWSSDAVENQY